ncbi:carboxymuconolactone decarboxylase family protein [Draconibacterium sediminis]|uniref:carboxymuconolactone decarboxylase family protein n=1 Tax=Draconibacterium sediminis TaxID=1544798 RepID=UPI0026EEBA04|nr:carboxymuconolactone decarboxylase family protein [Draconibacterium sediminis]
MTQFKLHTIETAPEGSKEILEGALKQNGFIPNLYKIMAESPEVLKAYTQMNQFFTETSLSPVEKNIVWLTVSFHNSCHYCMAIHSMVAQMFKLPDEMVEALRTNQLLSDTKLETLRRFTALLVEKRGWASDEEIQKFLDAGYTQKNVLELIVGIGQKIISNYVNHITHTPLDEQTEAFKWEANN